MNTTLIDKPGWQLCHRCLSPRDNKGKVSYLPATSPNALGFFEAIALAELEDCWIRLPAPTQRHFFGENIFGNKSIKVQSDGTVIVFWTVAFGHDWERVELRYDQLRKAFVYAGNESTWNRNNV